MQAHYQQAMPGQTRPRVCAATPTVPLARGPALPTKTADQQNNSSIDPSILAKADPKDQKQMLGEKLYPLIDKVYPGYAGKITGMLLELDNTELLLMLGRPDQLTIKVRFFNFLFITLVLCFHHRG